MTGRGGGGGGVGVDGAALGAKGFGTPTLRPANVAATASAGNARPLLHTASSAGPEGAGADVSLRARRCRNPVFPACFPCPAPISPCRFAFRPGLRTILDSLHDGARLADSVTLRARRICTAGWPRWPPEKTFGKTFDRPVRDSGPTDPGRLEGRCRFVAGMQAAAKGCRWVEGNGDKHALDYASRREPSVPVRAFFR